MTLLIICYICGIGNFSDPFLALWSSKNFQLMSSVRATGPIHDAAFSPSAADQMACVGSQGVYFCLLHTHGPNVDLEVNVFLHLSNFFFFTYLDFELENPVPVFSLIPFFLYLCRSKRWQHQLRWVMLSWQLCATIWTPLCSQALIKDMFVPGTLKHRAASWSGKLLMEK